MSNGTAGDTYSVPNLLITINELNALVTKYEKALKYYAECKHHVNENDNVCKDNGFTAKKALEDNK